MHILPKRFVKILHYGFLSSTWKLQKLKLLQEKLKVKVLEKVEKKPFYPSIRVVKQEIYTEQQSLTSVVHRLGILAVAKVQVPMKINFTGKRTYVHK